VAAPTPLTSRHCSSTPLCPACGNAIVRIDTSVEVKYRVHYAITAQDLEIIEEQVGDGDWDENSAAACDHCGWSGSVGELTARKR